MAGASGLFGVVLKSLSLAQAKQFADRLELFGIGASWGGFESLVNVSLPAKVRSATTWNPEAPLLRLHIGLEDPYDLIADIEASFARLASA